MSRLSGRVVAVTLALSLTGVGVAQARPSLAVLGVEAIDDSGDAAKQNETTELARLLTEALRARAEGRWLDLALAAGVSRRLAQALG